MAPFTFYHIAYERKHNGPSDIGIRRNECLYESIGHPSKYRCAESARNSKYGPGAPQGAGGPTGVGHPGAPVPSAESGYSSRRPGPRDRRLCI